MAELDDRLSAALGLLSDTPLAEPEPVHVLRKRGAGAGPAPPSGNDRVHARVRRARRRAPRDARWSRRAERPAPARAQRAARRFNAVVACRTRTTRTTHAAASTGAGPRPARPRPGVQKTSGIVQRFVPITDGRAEAVPALPRTDRLVPRCCSRTTKVRRSHSFAGALPTQADQLLIDRDLADRIDVSVGDRVLVARSRVRLTARRPGGRRRPGP